MKIEFFIKTHHDVEYPRGWTTLNAVVPRIGETVCLMSKFNVVDKIQPKEIEFIVTDVKYVTYNNEIYVYMDYLE